MTQNQTQKGHAIQNALAHQRLQTDARQTATISASAEWRLGMHTPISTLKSAARDAEATTVIDLVRRLFNLQERRTAKSGSGEND